MPGLRSLYAWTLRQAEKPYARWMLFLVAMIEPCLIPIPPDTLLIPMALARRDRAFQLALIATIGSVTGGVIGYGIGALGMATIGHWIVDTLHLEAGFEHFRRSFREYGMWIILAKGLTPIPFMVVAFASGIAKLNLGIFIVSAAITRGTRFFFEAWLIHHFGDPVRHFIEKHLPMIFFGALALIVLGFWVVLRA